MGVRAGVRCWGEAMAGGRERAILAAESCVWSGEQDELTRLHHIVCGGFEV